VVLEHEGEEAGEDARHTPHLQGRVRKCVCIGACVCMSVHVCECVCVCVCASLKERRPERMLDTLHICVCVFMYVRLCVCRCVCMYVFVYL
jgi:hypothetical protein